MRRPLDVFLAALAVGAALVGLRKATPSPIETSETTTFGAAGDGAPAVGAVSGWRLWVDEGRGVVARFREHNLVMIGASLSYYALLAVFPAAIAAVSIFGLVSDPETLEDQLLDLTDALPTATANFIASQLRTIVAGSESSLGFATVVGVAFALFSASAGVKALISGTNIAYGVEETRSFLTLRGVAYGLTVLIIVGLTGTLIAVSALPRIAEAVGLRTETTDFVTYARFPVVFLLVVIGLGALYKWAPNRPAKLTRLINVGGVLAAVLWVLATLAFSAYTNNLSTFGATYGPLTGLIVLMLWFFISGLIVLGGAELNSELESRRQESLV